MCIICDVCSNYVTKAYSEAYLCPFYKKKYKQVNQPFGVYGEKFIPCCDQFIYYTREVMKFDHTQKEWISIKFEDLRRWDIFTLNDKDAKKPIEIGAQEYFAVSDAFPDTSNALNWSIQLELLDETIDRWHRTEQTMPLHEFLGMATFDIIVAWEKSKRFDRIRQDKKSKLLKGLIK